MEAACREVRQCFQAAGVGRQVSEYQSASRIRHIDSTFIPSIHPHMRTERQNLRSLGAFTCPLRAQARLPRQSGIGPV
eukprot:3670565-Pleurochrysis_carterae.AAC.4